MPPSGFNSNAIKGALQFVRGCYEDLLADLKSGKYKTYEQAIEFELAQIEKALTSLHINERDGIISKENI